MRNIYESGLQTTLTQGSIINHCIAEDYPNSIVWGCVITPRCDLEHRGKVPTVHYLPIVELTDWINHYLKPKLKEQWKKDVYSRINTELKSCGAGEDLMKIFQEKDSILQIAKEIMKEKKFTAFQALCDGFFDGNTNAEKEYITKEKIIKPHIDRLIRNEIHGFYLIESWNKDFPDYKVILLRDVRRMQYDIALSFGKWFSGQGKKRDFFFDNDLSPVNDPEDYYMIESCICAPFIEHILESFSYNFTRIGIEDHGEELFGALSLTVKKVLL